MKVKVTNVSCICAAKALMVYQHSPSSFQSYINHLFSHKSSLLPIYSADT